MSLSTNGSPYPILLPASKITKYSKLPVGWRYMRRLTPSWIWTHNSQKYSIYTETLISETQILVRFTLWRIVFEIQGCQDRKNQKCTEWPQSDLEDLAVKSALQKATTYPRGPNFDDQSFSRSGTLIIPHCYRVKRPPTQKKKKKKNNCKKRKNLIFHNSLYSFGRDPPLDYAWILGEQSVKYVRKRCRAIRWLDSQSLQTWSRTQEPYASESTHIHPNTVDYWLEHIHCALRKHQGINELNIYLFVQSPKGIYY